MPGDLIRGGEAPLEWAGPARNKLDFFARFVLAGLQERSTFPSSVNSVLKQKQRHTKQAEGNRGVKASTGKRLSVVVFGILLLGLIVFAGVHHFSSSKIDTPKVVAGFTPAAQLKNSKLPKTLAELLSLRSEDLATVDIGLMNMLCAQDLPGAEDLKIDEHLRTLNQWAQRVKSETDRNFHRFREDPAYFYNSEAFYRMLMMSVVVYEDFGIRYNPKWNAPPLETREDDHFFAESRDIFIHGMIEPLQMGTCSSMPVFYIALGRRLGYPLKLVTTKHHLFMRWESPTERFNMDATSKGLDRYEDEEYKKWPFPISEQEIEEEGYLKSLSPREELSVFLAIRAACLNENGFYGDAAGAFQAAYQYAPNWKANQDMLARLERRQRPVVMPTQPQAVVFQQQEPNPKIPTDPSPFQQMPNSMKSP